MKIPRPKGLTTADIALGIVLGVISGVYIYKPFFDGLEKVSSADDKD